MPATRDIPVWKGNTLKLRFRFKHKVNGAVVPFDLTDKVLTFRVVWPGGSIKKTTPHAAMTVPTPANGEVTIEMAPGETRLLPMGTLARYEIEWLAGYVFITDDDGEPVDFEAPLGPDAPNEQHTLIYGSLKVAEWANDD